MYYGQIFKADMANGLGMRVSLFVSGCTNHCEGCFQPQTWCFEYGSPYTKEVEDAILAEVSKPQYDGLTILGGEPFELQNQETVWNLIKRFKKECPGKDVWMYTGFTYDRDLVPGGCRYTDVTDQILTNIAVLVDGKFHLAEKDIRLRYKGSRNQRVIDMAKTRESGTVVMHTCN